MEDTSVVLDSPELEAQDTDIEGSEGSQGTGEGPEQGEPMPFEGSKPMTFTYPVPDPAATAAKVRELGGPAIDPTQPTGEAVAHGVHLAWVIAAGIITITVVSKPFYVSTGTIKGALYGFFGGS